MKLNRKEIKRDMKRNREGEYESVFVKGCAAKKKKMKSIEK